MRLRSAVPGLVVGVVVVFAWVYQAARHGFDLDIGLQLAILAMGLLGALILIKRPGNRVGWLFAAAGIAGTVAALSVTPNPSALEGLAGGVGWWSWIFLTFSLVPFLFPTGHLLSRRWRWIVGLGVVGLVVISLLWTFQETVCIEIGEADRCIRTIDNPIGLSGVTNPEENAVGAIALLTLLFAAVMGLASLVIRFRRADQVEKQQIKWLLFAVSVLVVEFAIEALYQSITGADLEGPLYDVVVGVIWFGVPLAAGIAIFRYRLFEIDRIVSRTVTYALVVTFLLAIYGGVVGLLNIVLPLQGDLSVAASTLAVAALFNPLRRRLQRVVDRRFNRARYDAERVVDGLVQRLGSVTNVNDITELSTSAVAQSVQPAVLAIWIR